MEWLHYDIIRNMDIDILTQKIESSYEDETFVKSCMLEGHCETHIGLSDYDMCARSVSEYHSVSTFAEL